jgi:hypothetical protein
LTSSDKSSVKAFGLTPDLTPAGRWLLIVKIKGASLLKQS